MKPQRCILLYNFERKWMGNLRFELFLNPTGVGGEGGEAGSLEVHNCGHVPNTRNTGHYLPRGAISK